MSFYGWNAADKFIAAWKEAGLRAQRIICSIASYPLALFCMHAKVEQPGNWWLGAYRQQNLRSKTPMLGGIDANQYIWVVR